MLSGSDLKNIQPTGDQNMFAIGYYNMNEMENANPECLPDDGSTELLTGPCERNFYQIFPKFLNYSGKPN